jgi:DNA modification methylase
MKTTKLKGFSNNPRKISDKQFKELQEWLDELGDLSGVVHDLNSDQVISGIQRSNVFNLEECEITITEKYKKPTRTGTVALGYVVYHGEKFSYRQVRWTKKQCDKANIIANKAGGEWDFDILRGNFTFDDLSKWGFSKEELHFFDNEKIKEDGFDAEKEYGKIKKPQTQLGDIYQLNGHRLICGDSIDGSYYKTLLKGRTKPRLIHTDPPYNVDYQSQAGNSYNSGKYAGTKGKIFNDNKKPEEAQEFYSKTLENLYKYSSDDCTLYWWFAHKNFSINENSLINSKWHISQIVIWVKEHFVFALGQEYHRCYEPCIVAWKKGKKHFTNKKLSNLKDVFSLDFDNFIEMLDLWFIRRDNTNDYVHPTQKPVRLPERAIKKNSQRGDGVIDVFGGSGSTLIGCEQLKRYAYLMELDPKYCDVIVKRYIKYCRDNQISFRILKNGSLLNINNFIKG